MEKSVANLNRQNQEYRENEISLKNKLESAEKQLKGKMNERKNSAPNNAQIQTTAPSREENDIFSILKSRVKLVGYWTQ